MGTLKNQRRRARVLASGEGTAELTRMMSAVRVRMSMRSHEQARSRSIPLVVAWMFSARATVPLDRPMLAAVELCVDAARCLCCAVRRAGGLAVACGLPGRVVRSYAGLAGCWWGYVS